nr:reverse transcriptase domain-containing protein [Tanacetum cinerariifolium]
MGPGPIEQLSAERTKNQAQTNWLRSGTSKTGGGLLKDTTARQQKSARYTEALSESEDSRGGHWKSRSKKSSGEEGDLSQPWVFEETDPFTPRIRYFDFPKTRMPSHIKTYDGSEDSEDHVKIFQEAAKTERWAMPTWCHMFNSILTGNAGKKYIKDPIELYNNKQRDGESMEDFVRRYKLESRDVKGVPECMRNYWKTRSQKVTSSLVPLECAMVSGPKETSSAAKPIIEERVKVAINAKYPEQTVMIRSTLTEEGHNKLCGLLQRNLDIFAWKPADMTGVPRHITKHRLNVREGCSSVRQKKRGQTADRNQAIHEEVRNLWRQE